MLVTKGSLNPEIIRQSLDIVQARHPRLNSRIISDQKQLRFVTEGTQRIPFHIINNEDDQQLSELVLSELNRKIDSHLGLVRVVYVCLADSNTRYLITTIHHSVIDGLSSIRLHSEIFLYCQKLMAGKTDIQVDDMPVLPPLEDLLHEPMKGTRGKIKSVFFMLKSIFHQAWYQPVTLKFEKFVPTELRRSGFVKKVLDKNTTGQLVMLCRKNNTTVQGAICAALMRVVYSRIKVSKKSDNLHFNCLSYIDLRRRLKPVISDQQPGVLVSSLNSYHKIQKNTSFWELAQDVTRKINAGLKNDDIFSSILIFKNILNYLILPRPNKATSSASVTNVGQVTISDDYTFFKLEEISFIPASAMFGGNICAAVTSFQDKMILNFCYSVPSLSQETVRKIADDVLDELYNVCKNG